MSGPEPDWIARKRRLSRAEFMDLAEGIAESGV